MQQYLSTKNIIIGVVVLALVVSAVFFLGGGDLSGTAGDDDNKVSDENANERVSYCHIAGLAEDPANTILLENMPLGSLNGHFENNGTPKAGHEQDFLIPPVPASLQGLNYPVGSAGACVPPAPTATPVPPTPVPPTPVPPTNTPVPPTDTPVPPTETPIPPTDTPVPPTETPIPPTDTPVPPTETPVPPTETPTDETPIPPTNTPVPPTDTPSPNPVCGQIGVDANGFPIIDRTTPCGDDEVEVDWTPIEPGEAVCPDWLLYHTNQTGDYEIFRLGDLADNANADPNVSQGVGEGVFDLAPSRSADSEWVVFSTNRDGNFEVYVTRPDGTDQQRVTIDQISNAPIDTDPVWSPSGQYIAYESLRGATWDLYLFDVTTGQEVRLTQSGSHDINPYWHPDSQSIIFQTFRDGFWQLYTIDIETFEETLISDGTGDDHDPQYNDDGSELIFRSFRDGDNSVIYHLDIESGDLTQISNPDGYASNQVWSDDEALIAYQSDLVDANGNNDIDIYIYEVATGAERLLTDNDIPDYAPTWYCNSNTVVWTSDFVAQDDPNLFSADADISLPSLVDLIAESTQLTDDPNVDQYPQNSPSEENASRQDQVPGSLKNR